MLFSFFEKRLRTRSLCIVLGVVVTCSGNQLPLKAEPCGPSDPEGLNPDGLCLVYPTHGMTLGSTSFREGYANEGYYGRSVGPGLAGSPIIPNHQPGAPIDSRKGENGYWSGIEASQGRTTVRMNTGKEWNLKLQGP
jgi:hypothetical protein